MKPTLGRIVLYFDPYLSHEIPALVTRVYTPRTGEGQSAAGGSLIDLTAFPPGNMPVPVQGVVYAEAAGGEVQKNNVGSWRWPPRD